MQSRNSAPSGPDSPPITVKRYNHKLRTVSAICTRDVARSRGTVRSRRRRRGPFQRRRGVRRRCRDRRRRTATRRKKDRKRCSVRRRAYRGRHPHTVHSVADVSWSPPHSGHCFLLWSCCQPTLSVSWPRSDRNSSKISSLVGAVAIRGMIMHTILIMVLV